jgi:2'-5' RNA ligase
VSADPPDAPAADERVRLFVALELPDAVRDQLSRWTARVVEGLDGVRLIEPSDLHSTLCFLGWRLGADIDAIREACGILAAHPAPELRVREATWIPPRRPRVLAVELADLSSALARAQAALSEVLEAGGWYRRENRPYLAHVTVARMGRGARASDRAPPSKRALPDAPALSFRASRVTLYRSRLLRSGARYDPLASVELARTRPV